MKAVQYQHDRLSHLVWQCDREVHQTEQDIATAYVRTIGALRLFDDAGLAHIALTKILPTRAAIITPLESSLEQARIDAAWARLARDAEWNSTAHIGLPLRPATPRY